jgi:hypothetical protein
MFIWEHWRTIESESYSIPQRQIFLCATAGKKTNEDIAVIAVTHEMAIKKTTRGSLWYGAEINAVVITSG